MKTETVGRMKGEELKGVMKTKVSEVKRKYYNVGKKERKGRKKRLSN